MLANRLYEGEGSKRPSFQNDPFLAREFSRFEEENVGKTTPPTLRQVLGSAINRDGRNVKVPMTHEPRVQLDILKSAKSARNKALTKFDFAAV